MFKLFTSHPHAVGETYLQHLRFATCFGMRMVLGGLACMAHGVLPFLFPTKGTSTVTELGERAQQRQHRAAGHLPAEYHAVGGR